MTYTKAEVETSQLGMERDATNMTITEAINQFKVAEKQGYSVPDTTDPTIMTEEEVIRLAEYLTDRGDN